MEVHWSCFCFMLEDVAEDSPAHMLVLEKSQCLRRDWLNGLVSGVRDDVDQN